LDMKNMTEGGSTFPLRQIFNIYNVKRKKGKGNIGWLPRAMDLGTYENQNVEQYVPSQKICKLIICLTRIPTAFFLNLIPIGVEGPE